jgi:hypothetical protein
LEIGTWRPFAGHKGVARGHVAPGPMYSLEGAIFMASLQFHRH